MLNPVLAVSLFTAVCVGIQPLLPTAATAPLPTPSTATVTPSDDPAQAEIEQLIMERSARVRRDKTTDASHISRRGAMEFWSSGGLLNEVHRGMPQMRFKQFSLQPKHIHVTTLVEGKAVVAHYYSEGVMEPAGSSAVTRYCTRVTEVLVKEDDAWVVRSAHFSPLAGGQGTTMTALPQQPRGTVETAQSATAESGQD